MIGTSWMTQRQDFTARIERPAAEAGKRVAELADLLEERHDIDSTPAWDSNRSCWQLRITEPADSRLHMVVWLRDDEWSWVPGCAWRANAADYARVIDFTVTWVTEHRVAL